MIKNNIFLAASSIGFCIYIQFLSYLLSQINEPVSIILLFQQQSRQSHHRAHSDILLQNAQQHQYQEPKDSAKSVSQMC